MARLILEEGGARRAFRVKEGRLTIGSGEGCTLKLASPGIAEVHAEIAFSNGVATLEPKPGVVPPQLDGVAVSEPTVIPHGSDFEIGEASFRLEYEDPSTAPASKAVRRPTPVTKRSQAKQASPPKPAAVQKPRPKAPAAEPRAERPRVERRTRKIERGAPTWLIMVIVVVVVVVGFFGVKGMLGGMGEGTLEPVAAFNQALRHFDEGAYDYAGKHLDRIEEQNPELSDNLRAKIRGLRERIKGKNATAELFIHNEKGTKWLETQLKRFVNDRLQGDPKRERVRIFLMRCQEFRQRWPQHPDFDWVVRYEARFKPFYDFSQPLSFEDVAYEVKTLTWAMPRNYVKAFDILATFRESAEVTDRVKVDALVETLTTEQAEYALDRMQQARYHWEKEEQSLAVGWLIELVVGLSDPELVEQAARELTQLPGVEPDFPSYKEHEPEKWALLMENPTVRAMKR